MIEETVKNGGNVSVKVDEVAKVIDVTTAPEKDNGNDNGNGVAKTTSGTTEDPIKVVFDQSDGIPKHLTGPIDWNHPQAAHVKIIDAEKGIIERKRKKVCIVGYAEVSRHLAFYDDLDCEIWGVNQLYRFIPRADRWFQIHSDWNDKTKWAGGTDLAEWLKTCPIPVYMIEQSPEIPNSVIYPKARVMETLGTHDYFTSSIAFMIALAIAEGFEEIGIYGIDLIIGREYHFEKPCAEFYLGIAQAKGITYHIPKGCALLWQSHCYGYEIEPNDGFFSLSKLEKRVAQLNGLVKVANNEVNLWQGRFDEATHLKEKLPESFHSDLDKHILELRMEIDKRLNKLFMYDGACQEVERMREILDAKQRGAQVI